LTDFVNIFSRREIGPYPASTLKKGHTIFSPDVYLVEFQGEPVVWKDYSKRPWLGRLWGRFVIAREGKALARLKNVKGVPEFRGFVERDGLLMKYCEGNLLPRRGAKKTLSPDFFSKCAALLEEIHAHGIAHGDIRRRNILADKEGNPVLIDFQTALRKEEWLGRFLFGIMCRTDKWNLVRIKAKSFAWALTEEEKELLASPPLFLRLGRFLRRGVYRKLFPKHT